MKFTPDVREWGAALAMKGASAAQDETALWRAGSGSPGNSATSEKANWKRRSVSQEIAIRARIGKKSENISEG
jgi:hypothetical protein